MNNRFNPDNRNKFSKFVVVLFFLVIANTSVAEVIPAGGSGWTDPVSILSIRPDGTGNPVGALFRIFVSNTVQNPGGCMYEDYTLRSDAANYSQNTAIALAALVSGKKVRLFLDGRTTSQACQPQGHIKVAHIQIFCYSITR